MPNDAKQPEGLSLLAVGCLLTPILLAVPFLGYIYQFVYWTWLPILLGGTYVLFLGVLFWLFYGRSRKPSRQKEKPSRRRLLRISARLLLLSAIVLTAGFFLNRAARNARLAAQGAECNGKLCSLGISLHYYHEKYGHFPPAYTVDSKGNRLHSWRVLLLEFVDRPLFAEVRLDEPWNSPTNSKLAGRMPRTYACSSDVDAEQRGWTSYVVVVGDATAFPHSKTVSLADVKDDRGSTILIAEHSDSGIPWMEPRDLEFDTMSFAIDDPAGIHSRHRPNVCFVDGARRPLVEPFSGDQLKAMLTISGGEIVPAP